MSIVIYNTLSREKQPFEPLDSERVTMYQCGPTVYNYAHIGNARPAVIFDLLYRLLQREYPEVVFARNFTDVDDKINAAAAEQGVPISTITERFTAAYREDMAALGVGQPSLEPFATRHIDVMIGMIERLIADGHAYAEQGHVLFDVTSYENYGNLSRRDRREMIAGARVEVAPYKRNPADFVLWKPSVDPQPGWDSPWGWGRPGWHLECSAMCAKHLGETIDIHAGGQDLIFPHHENEIAQSVCAHRGKPFARFWLHNGFVTVEKRKMSKSLGNTLTVHELLRQHRGETLRYVLLNAHYRQPLDWSEQVLEQARRTLDRLYAVLRDSLQRWGVLAPGSVPRTFLAALQDDLNTPRALAELNRIAKALANADQADDAARLGGELLASGDLIGLLNQDPNTWLAGQSAEVDVDLVERMIEDRNQARATRDFERADQLRDQLSAMGVVLEDSAGGTRWKVVSETD